MLHLLCFNTRSNRSEALINFSKFSLNHSVYSNTDYKKSYRTYSRFIASTSLFFYMAVMPSDEHIFSASCKCKAYKYQSENKSF